MTEDERDMPCVTADTKNGLPSKTRAIRPVAIGVVMTSKSAVDHHLEDQSVSSVYASVYAYVNP